MTKHDLILVLSTFAISSSLITLIFSIAKEHVHIPSISVFQKTWSIGFNQTLSCGHTVTQGSTFFLIQDSKNRRSRMVCSQHTCVGAAITGTRPR